MQIKHVGASGIRINVLKPGLKRRTVDNLAQDWTSVYVRARDLAELLALAGDSVATVTQAVRAAAPKGSIVRTKSFSRDCVAGAKRVLARARAVADLAAAAGAADNNAEWA